MIGPRDAIAFMLGLTVGIFLTVLFAFALRIVSPYFRAFLSGAPVPLITLIGMLLRGNPVNLLIDAHISLRHRGTPTPIHEVESTYIAQRGKIMTSEDLVQLLSSRSSVTPS